MKITLWSIQAEEMWHQALQSGVLRADPSYIEPFWIQPYSWIEKQMTKRIGPPPEGVIHPIWAWYSYKKILGKPDLRCYHVQPGKKCVLLKIEIDSSQVLLTDFDDWHIVLNTGDEESIANECTVLENDFMPIEEVEFPWEVRGENVAKPWEGIIQPLDSKLHYVQATTWEIKIDQVKKVRYFTGRK